MRGAPFKFACLAYSRGLSSLSSTSSTCSRVNVPLPQNSFFVVWVRSGCRPLWCSMVARKVGIALGCVLVVGGSCSLAWHVGTCRTLGCASLTLTILSTMLRGSRRPCSGLVVLTVGVGPFGCVPVLCRALVFSRLLFLIDKAIVTAPLAASLVFVASSCFRCP